MSLTLYYHPLAAFCWKTLIALYENKTPFTPLIVDFGNEKSRSELLEAWPMGEFPVLRDDRKDRTIPQSTVIIDYLDLYYPGASPLIPSDRDLALQTRSWNEFLDNYVHVPMQKIVEDCMRPTDKKDPLGVKDARETLQTAYGILEGRMKGREWMVGDQFTLADCAACPSLFYGEKVEHFGEKYPTLTNYLSRLSGRPSFARVLEEAKPYFHFFPYRDDQQISVMR